MYIVHITSACTYIRFHIGCTSPTTLHAEVIIEYIANLDVGDRTGKTALHHAAYNGHVEMLSLLLLKGANVKAQDRSERTPLHYAAFMG